MTEMFDPDADGDLELPPLDRADEPDVTDVEVVATPPREEEISDESEPTAGRWVPVPTPPDPDGTIWHYTDSGGAIGILSSQVLWATSMGSLNDAMEFEYGLTPLRELLKEVQDSRHIHPLQKRFIAEVHARGEEVRSLSPLFVVCASEDGDSLSQWRAYGGSVGHAIGLDPGAMAAVLDVSHATRPHAGDSVIPRWGRVLYRAEDQRNFLLQTLSFVALQCPLPERYAAEGEAAIGRAVPWLLAALAYCKHPSFADEKEVRLVLQGPDELCISFRPTRFGVTPYISVTFTDTARGFLPRSLQQTEQFPVAAVAIGPTAHGSTAAEGTRLLLRRVGLEGVPVTETQAPFR